MKIKKCRKKKFRIDKEGSLWHVLFNTNLHEKAFHTKYGQKRKVRENLSINFLLFVEILMVNAYNKGKKIRRCDVMANVMDCLVPISLFNKGQATKIFSRLRETKELFVLKNNQPSAVILSPEEYVRLTEIEENYTLLLEAASRLEENGDRPGISMEVVMDELGINAKELEEMEDVDIE